MAISYRSLARILHVKPQRVTTTNRGQVQPNGDEIFKTSDTGPQQQAMWVWLVDVFELPDSTDKEEVIANLAKGLELALGDHPELTGTMHFDNEAKRIVVKRSPDASTALHIRDATYDNENTSDEAQKIPSYAWYHSNDYPVHRLKVDQLIAPEATPLPMVIAESLSVPGPVVSAFQATLIPGGLIMGSAISHQVSDGLGVDAFCSTWAAYAKSVTTGKPPSSFLTPSGTVPPSNLFTAPQPPSPEKFASLRGKFPTLQQNNGPPAPPPADFVPPQVKTRVFHFPMSSLRKLKALCSVGLPVLDCPYISSYDAVAALWWRVMLRARQPYLDYPASAETRAVHAVNLRRRADPEKPVSERFIGSSVALPYSREGQFTVGDILDPPLEEVLPKLAREVRGVTAQVTPEYVRDMVLWGSGAEDARWNMLNVPWIGGRDCMGLGWHDMQTYQKHDYGFGLPTGFRWPDMRFESFFFMLPSRRGQADRGEDEGFEITFSVEEGCWDRVQGDEELGRFCEMRGKGT